ncbi:MAG TPA: carboxypeptidase-like regulatory domain-containing protein [Verrucomicrobiae bacterium]|nr:carboxypeptidase-like regulatory domain-containing protein [Verrucomicrobiae bacterium]
MRGPSNPTFPIRLAIASLIVGLVPVAGAVCWGQSNNQGSSSAQGQSSSGSSSSAKDGGSGKKDEKGSAQQSTRIRMVITSDAGKPISNASVYVKFPVDGGLFHHDKLQEMDLKTNEDGSVKVPPIPQGKILVQVVAKGWRPYGKWYDVETDEQLIEIKLAPPPHWY